MRQSHKSPHEDMKDAQNSTIKSSAKYLSGHYFKCSLTTVQPTNLLIGSLT